MKAFFFDVDGTLFDRQRGVDEIPGTVKQQLSRLHDRGHKLFVCSGRPYKMIGEDILLPVFDGCIAFNGGQVEIEGVTVFSQRMDPALSTDAADLFEELGCDYMIETAHHVYLDRSFRELYDFFEPFVEPGFFTQEFDRDDALGRAIKLEANVLERNYRRVMEAIRGKFGFVAVADTHGTDHSFELYSSAISKAVGIAKVLEHYGIAPEDAVGIGDGANDLEMIRTCGLGVAMGNAEDALKAEADVVIGNVEDDGLAEYLAGIA